MARTPRSVLALAAYHAKLLAAVALVVGAQAAIGSDWPRFRGDNGSGISPDKAATPTEWSETKNLKWSVDLPGRGSSSPIVVGDRVIVTCWTGDGPEDLMRHLLCFDRKTGKKLWDKSVPPAVTDEPYKGQMTEHGYASHTPASDGKHIYAFFGKSGAYAFDMDGNQVWQKPLGEGSDKMGWGTAASVVLYKDLVIVNASAESMALVALAKDDGHVVWRQEADGIHQTWGTPILVDAENGEKDLVLAVPGEVWGINPDNGKLRWYDATGGRGMSQCGSAIAEDGVVYVLGEQNAETVAVRAGGKGDLAKTDSVVWTGKQSGRIGTPVADKGLIYYIAGGVATCLDAKTGDQVYQERLKAPKSEGEAAKPDAPKSESPKPDAPKPDSAKTADQPPTPTGFGRPGDFGPPPGAGGPGGPGPGPGGPAPGGPGGGRGGMGGMRGQDYSSPVAADGKLYFTRRSGETYVIELGREFKQLAVSKFASDDGDFSATPALADGNLFIRSSKKLYCVGKSD